MILFARLQLFLLNTHSNYFHREGASYPALEMDSCVISFLLGEDERTSIALWGVSSKEDYCSSGNQSHVVVNSLYPVNIS